MNKSNESQTKTLSNLDLLLRILNARQKAITKLNLLKQSAQQTK